MEFIRKEKSLVLKVDDDAHKMLLAQMDADGIIDTDAAMYELFDYILPNTEWEWIRPEEIGALTSAPILGTKDENEEVVEAYGFMDYAVRSLLGDLFEYGEAELQKG